MQMFSVCVCVRERERERQYECMYESVNVQMHVCYCTPGETNQFKD
jgi:hypothetical protein